MSSAESIRNLLASAKVDVIKSNALLIDAMAGNDRITGGSAAQTIYGGSGNDVIQGAGGDDILWGDGSSTGATFVAGKDTFVFEKTLTDNGVDTIMDFGIAGHKTDGVLQTGTYVADTLDLSHVKFTDVSTSSEHDEGEEVHITAANVNDYVSVKDGDLYIDTDGVGAGQAQLWAHLNGVNGGDLINLKFDDANLQIQATATPKGVLDFEAVAAISDIPFFVVLMAAFDGDLAQDTTNPEAVLVNGKSVAFGDLAFADLVSVTANGQSSNQVLTDATWTANTTLALGTVDVSTWTDESVMTNLYKYAVNQDLNSDKTINYQDVLAYQQNVNPDFGGEVVAYASMLKQSFDGQVVAYFGGSTFAVGEAVDVVGVYQGQEVTHSIVALV